MSKIMRGKWQLVADLDDVGFLSLLLDYYYIINYYYFFCFLFFIFFIKNNYFFDGFIKR